MHYEQFYLVLTMGSNMVIQAPQASGTRVSLQILAPGNAYQLWTLQPQVTAGYSGVAFVNAYTGMAITYNGPSQPLLGYTYNPGNPGTDRMDTWYVTPGTGSGNLQIAYVKDLDAQGNATYFWQDFGGKAQPGDQIVPRNDIGRGGNAGWTFRLATPAELRGTDDDQASADVTAPSSVAELAGATA